MSLSGSVKDPNFLSSGLTELENSLSKCITLEGNYIKKKRWMHNHIT